MPTLGERVTDAIPRVKNETSTGQLLSVALVIIAGAVAWGTSQSEIRALAQRADAGEKRDDKTAETLGEVKGSVIELKSDNRAIKADLERQGRQMDRQSQQMDEVLRILRAQPAPQSPTFQPPR